jgi:transcriptional regulator with XRE-family HTH domain
MIVESRSDFQGRLKDACESEEPAEIARKLGIPYQTVKNYLGGRLPAADVLIRISDTTNVSIHWLLTGVGPKQVDDLAVSGGRPLYKKRSSERGAKNEGQISPEMKDEIRRQIFEVLKSFPLLSEKDREFADSLVRTIEPSLKPR